MFNLCLTKLPACFDGSALGSGDNKIGLQLMANVLNSDQVACPEPCHHPITHWESMHPWAGWLAACKRCPNRAREAKRFGAIFNVVGIVVCHGWSRKSISEQFLDSEKVDMRQ